MSMPENAAAEQGENGPLAGPARRTAWKTQPSQTAKLRQERHPSRLRPHGLLPPHGMHGAAPHRLKAN